MVCYNPLCNTKFKLAEPSGSSWMTKALFSVRKEFSGHNGTATAHTCYSCSGSFCTRCMSRSTPKSCHNCEKTNAALAKVKALCFDSTSSASGSYAGMLQLQSLYTLGEVIGKGGFSSVYSATPQQKSIFSADQRYVSHYAIKCISKTKMRARAADQQAKHANALYNEISILRELNDNRHEHIYRLYGFYDEQDQCYLVTEHMAGGTILEWMVASRNNSDISNSNNNSDGSVSESTVCQLMAQACSALAHCHSRGIIHRDIKPSNLLVTSASSSSNAQLKIADWGLATRMQGNRPTNQWCGTWEYMSPEILNGAHYDQRHDVWAVAQVLHFLLSGEHVFNFRPTTATANINGVRVVSEADKRQFGALVRRGPDQQQVWGASRWAHVSSSCTDLVHQMMNPEQSARPHMQQVLQHAWFTQQQQQQEQGYTNDHKLPREVFEKLSRWLQEHRGL